MRCIIIYFTQTGNTEKVAKAICKGVKQTTDHCELVTMKDANPRRLYEYDLIGFGSPVIGGVPGNVQAFIQNMRFVGGKHAFAFITHGTFPELFFPNAIPKMNKRGLVVIGARGWYGNCYLLHMPEPYPTAGHPDEKDLKEAEDFGREMVDRSRRISCGEKGLIPPLPPMPQLGKEGGDPGKIPNFTKMVTFSKEICIYPECRLCMEYCPMDGFDLTVDPPVIAKPCISCEFCVKICPTGAINADAFVEEMARATHHIMSIRFLPALEKAEKEGRFRRLVPLEEVGFETPSYKIHRKNPMWIIGKGWNPNLE